MHGAHCLLLHSVAGSQKGSPYQLRERYVGEWVGGRREGRGTFYYASGAPCNTNLVR